MEKFLPSVCQSTYGNLELYLADNASTDDSVAFTQTHFPQVKIIRNPSNNGFAGGYNEALQHVQADIYVLLNQDVEFSIAVRNSPRGVDTSFAPP